jgi:hypothetical protein
VSAGALVLNILLKTEQKKPLQLCDRFIGTHTAHSAEIERKWLALACTHSDDCAIRLSTRAFAALSLYCSSNMATATQSERCLAQRTVNNCMRVAISQLDANKTNINNSASWIVNYWENRADAEATLLATNYISCYSGPTVYTYFRNQPVIDGGYSSGFKQLW